MFRLLAVVAVALFASIHLALGQPPFPPDAFDAAYSFNTTNFLSEDGDPPINLTNLVLVPLWNKNALLLDTTNAIPAFLNYNVVESDNFTNVDFGQGGLRCVFITDWATADTNQNGAGPGQTCYLVAAGDWADGSPLGFWSLFIDQGGTNIYFGGVSNSTTNIFVSASISWPSNSLHLIGVLYSSTNSELFLDGQLAATGGPVTIVPATNTWTNGFFVGSDSSGYEQARGIFSTLEFFNSNCFDTTWSDLFTNGFLFTNAWPHLTNNYYTWLAGGGSSGDSGSGGGLLSGGGSDTFTISGGLPGYEYDVFMTTNLLLAGINHSAWTWLGRGTNCGIYYITNQPSTLAFYMLGTPLIATNDGGLTVAYGNLISTNISSDGFGTPNAWYLSEGINPQMSGVGTNDPDGDTLLNWQEYLYGSNPLVSEGFTVWVADPMTTSGIP
jgi:hypothetical protein